MSEIAAAIRAAMADEPRVKAVFGFGSFFRRESFRDIDLVVVLADDCADLSAADSAVRGALLGLESSVGTRLDITPLTESEFADQPLRECLQPLYVRPTGPTRVC